MDKQKAIKLFNEVLDNWKTAQGCIIAEGGGCEPYSHDELDKDIEGYRHLFFEALGE